MPGIKQINEDQGSRLTATFEKTPAEYLPTPTKKPAKLS